MSESKRGRPKEFDGLISVRLTRELHNDLTLEALRRGIDVADVVRERLSRPISYLKNRRRRRRVHNQSIRRPESGPSRQATCATPDDNVM